MQNVRMKDVQKTDESGRPVLELTVRGKTVEAVFLADETSTTLSQVKAILRESYVHHFADTLPAPAPIF